MQDYEVAFIYPSLEVQYSETFNCYKCQENPFKRADHDKHLENLKKVKSCYEPNAKKKYQYENIKYYLCPGNYTSRAVLSCIDLYLNYEKGLLPYKGSLLEQPYKIIQIFQVIEAFRREKDSRNRANGERNTGKRRR